ncbi:MAG: peptidoglycan DD-metalloendopeptidase family protein [Thermoanaerobaculia bacterium]
MHTYPHPPFKIGGGHISQDYSARHKAKDITHRDDAPDTVYAIENCTVTGVQSGKNEGDGEPNLVIVKDGVGNLTIYAHVDPSVDVGDYVTQGSPIGTADMSGASDGVHVHLVRMSAGPGTVEEVMTRVHMAVNYRIHLLAW